MKKILLIIVLLFFVSVHPLSAQQLNFSWAKAMGAPNNIGNAAATGICIAHDANGNVFLAGTFQDTIDFDPGPGTAWLTSTISYDVFIAKFDDLGNLIWVRSIEGTEFEGPVGLVVDGNGNPIVLGQFRQTIDVNPDPFISNLITSNGKEDAFLIKLDATGNYQWSRQFGGTEADVPIMLRKDNAGNLLVTGSFKDTVDFDPSAATQQLISNGVTDGFLVKLNSLGNLLWVNKFGGTLGDDMSGLDVDASGNIYACGSFLGTVDFDPGVPVFNLSAISGTVASYLLKLDSLGNFMYAKPFLPVNSSSTINATYLNLDPLGNVYMVGNFSRLIDFNPDVVAQDTISSASLSQDVFVVKMNAAGIYQWARKFGNSNIDYCTAIVSDNQGYVYFKGSFSGSIDINPHPIDSFILNSTGGTGGRVDYFCVLNTNGGFSWGTKLFGFTNGYRGPTLDFDQNKLYHAGQFTGTGDFDPGPGVFNMSGVPGSGTAFFSQLSRTTIGITEQETQSGISVFPNPTTDRINIIGKEDFRNAHISLMTVSGQTVKAVSGVSGISYTMDVSDVAQGMYLLQVRSEKLLVTIKVLVSQ